MRNKIVSAADAVAVIRPGDTLATSGFVGIGTPDELLAALSARFVESGEPRNLTLVFAAGQGDGKERGLNRLGHDGLLKRVDRRPLGPDPQGRRSSRWRTASRPTTCRRAASRTSTATSRRASRACCRRSASAPSSIRGWAAARSTR